MRAASLTFGVTGATRIVTKVEDTDDGLCDFDCSLREALMASSDGKTSVDRIEFARPFFDTPRTIVLGSTLSVLNRPVAIVGPGAPTLTINGRGQHHLRFSAGNGKTSLSGLRISHATGLEISDLNSALLQDIEISYLRGQIALSISEINNSSIHSNWSNGALLALWASTLRRTTISSNVVVAEGAGPSALRADFLTLIDCSIVGNHIFGYQATSVFARFGNFAQIQNTVIASNKNFGDTPYGDVGGSFESLGHNVIGNIGIVTAFNRPSDQTGTATQPLNPMLGPLSRNGGTIPTHAPLRASPLLDRGRRTGKDVRGVHVVRLANMTPWPGSNQSDVGAVEVNPRLVLQLGDRGDGSLREALNSLSFGTVIDVWFPLDLPSGAKIELTSGELVVNQNVAIHGPGARKLTISGNGASRILVVRDNKRLSISGLSLRDGYGAGNQNSGLGAILLNRPGSQLSLVESEISLTGSANALWHVFDGAFGELWGSTLSEANVGVSISAGTLEVVRSTIAVLDTAIASQGPPTDGTDMTTEASLLSSTLSGAISCDGVVRTFIQNAILDSDLIHCTSLMNRPTSLGHNLIRAADINAALAFIAPGDQVGTQSNPINLRLSTLSYHGGQVATRVPLAASPALDRGMRFGPLDARGQARFDIVDIAEGTLGDNSDIGAVEVRALFVSNTNDSLSFSPGSLRHAMLVANNNGIGLDDILLDISGTISLLSKLPTPNPDSAINILGIGANRISVSRSNTAPAFGLLNFSGPGHLSINGITMNNGLDDGSHGEDGVGGALQTNGPDVFLSDAEFVGNSATQAGAVSIANSAAVIQRCTFAANNAWTNAGALQFLGNGKHLLIRDSTISGNNAAQDGGAITHLAVKTPSLLEIESVTLADNSPPAITTSGFSGGAATTRFRNTLFSNTTNFRIMGTASVSSLGFNLSTSDEPWFNRLGDITNQSAMLAPLDFNGGTTRTHALLQGSSAIDAGLRTAIFDQRGMGRPNDLPSVINTTFSDGSDIGSFETFRDTTFADGFEGTPSN